MKITNSEFIKKYGRDNLKSLVGGVQATLYYLKYKKEIPSYKINNQKYQVKFYKKGKFLSIDIATIFYMSENEIKKFVKRLEREV